MDAESARREHDTQRLVELTSLTERDTTSIRFTLGVTRGGTTLEADRAAHRAREDRAATRIAEVGRMCREEEVAMFARCAELEQRHAELIQTRADAETQTRIARELEAERRAATTRAVGEPTRVVQSRRLTRWHFIEPITSSSSPTCF